MKTYLIIVYITLFLIFISFGAYALSMTSTIMNIIGILEIGAGIYFIIEVIKTIFNKFENE